MQDNCKSVRSFLKFELSGQVTPFAVERYWMVKPISRAVVEFFRSIDLWVCQFVGIGEFRRGRLSFGIAQRCTHSSLYSLSCPNDPITVWSVQALARFFCFAGRQ